MIENQPPVLQAPLFWPLFSKALGYYRASFKGLIVLTLTCYLPFFIIGLFSHMDLSDPMELLHGFLLDILVCLALPTIMKDGKIYPLATLKIFQDYFAQGVVIILGQMFFIFFLMVLFSSFGLMFLFFALFPFVFVLFTGQFSLINGKPKIMDLAENLASSFTLVKANFRLVLFSYLNISLLMILPILVFSLYYLGSNPNTSALLTASAQAPSGGLDMQEVVNQVKGIVGEPGYQKGRLVIHLLVRPLKSLFMALLLARLLATFNPDQYERFFQLPAEPTKPNPE